MCNASMFNIHKGIDMETDAIKLVPLALERRTILPTAEAALHLNRAQQTLRLWAMQENGPIQPIRINGRLGWPVSDIKRVLGGGEMNESSIRTRHKKSDEGEK